MADPKLVEQLKKRGTKRVKTEIAKARKRELQEERRVLFPLRLVDFTELRDWECFDADAGKDSAREIREYYVPDFSNWKDHDTYQNEFEKLLRDLKRKTPKAPSHPSKPSPGFSPHKHSTGA